MKYRITFADGSSQELPGRTSESDARDVGSWFPGSVVERIEEPAPAPRDTIAIDLGRPPKNGEMYVNAEQDIVNIRTAGASYEHLFESDRAIALRPIDWEALAREAFRVFYHATPDDLDRPTIGRAAAALRRAAMGDAR